MYGSNFCMVTLSPRSTSRRPSEAAAMPLPSEDTTPPVTKMYLVALVPVISPVLGKRASGLPPVEDLPLYLPRVTPAQSAAPPRCLYHCEARAAAPAARPALPGSAAIQPSEPAQCGCRHRSRCAASTDRRWGRPAHGGTE